MPSWIRSRNGQALVAVVLRDRDDEAEVRLDHLLLRVEVAALDALGEVDLLLRGEQADLADVLEEQLQRVRRHVRPEVERRLLRAAAARLSGARSTSLRGGRGRVDLLDQLDLRPSRKPWSSSTSASSRSSSDDRRRDLGVGEHAELPCPRARRPLISSSSCSSTTDMRVRSRFSGAAGARADLGRGPPEPGPRRAVRATLGAKRDPRWYSLPRTTAMSAPRFSGSAPF